MPATFKNTLQELLFPRHHCCVLGLVMLFSIIIMVGIPKVDCAASLRQQREQILRVHRLSFLATVIQRTITAENCYGELNDKYRSQLEHLTVQAGSSAAQPTESYAILLHPIESFVILEILFIHSS